MGHWHDVCKQDAFTIENPRQVVNIASVRILVCWHDNAFYAIEDSCSHAQASLACGPILGDDIVCPRHGARFSLKSGEATAMPGLTPIKRF